MAAAAHRDRRDGDDRPADPVAPRAGVRPDARLAAELLAPRSSTRPPRSSTTPTRCPRSSCAPRASPRLHAFPSSLSDLKRAVAVEPRNWVTWALVGDLLTRRGDRSGARAAYAARACSGSARTRPQERAVRFGDGSGTLTGAPTLRRRMSVRFAGSLASALVATWLVAGPAAALEPGVFVDPGSPAGKEYGVPLSELRGAASGHTPVAEPVATAVRDRDHASGRRGATRRYAPWRTAPITARARGRPSPPSRGGFARRRRGRGSASA